jgi:hypothetical protein
LGGLPETLGGLPETLGELPETLGELPETLGELPESLGNIPIPSKKTNRFSFHINFLIHPLILKKMGRERDFISSNDAVFDNWQKNLLQQLSEKSVLSNWDIPQQAYEDLLPLQADWDSHYAVAKNPKDRTQAQVTAKNKARKTFENALRIFIKAYLTYNPKVSDDERDVLGLPVHKKGRTSAPIPKGYPFFRIDSSVLRRLTVYFFDDANEKRQKPEGVHGAEIRWDFSDAPVVEPEKLTRSGFDTASPYTIEFSGEDRGRTVYITMRWENTRGGKGPWGEILNTIVP